MKNSSNKRKFSPTVWHPAARWAFVLALCAVVGVVISYYWRVFYGLDPRGVSPLQVTGFCVVLAMAAGAAALLLRRCKDFAGRGAVCILLCGALFAFADPPMQTPDETDHYLRTYAISMGRFDFDAQRTYPEDVDELMAAFPGAWVNAHTSAGLGTDPDTHAEQPYNSAGHALKQYGKDGKVESIWDSFTRYLTWQSRDAAAKPATEPISFLAALFQSITTRTAGFSTIDIGAMTNAGLLVVMILMFIGASPGSTGGGIKTTTFFVLMQEVRIIFSKRRLGAFKRRLPKESLDKAATITLLGAVVVFVGTFVLCVLEPQLSFVQLLFEQVSAYSTAGLSMGITAGLHPASKAVLIATMFIGRVGAFTLLSLWVTRPEPSAKYTEEAITIG